MIDDEPMNNKNMFPPSTIKFDSSFRVVVFKYPRLLPLVHFDKITEN